MAEVPVEAIRKSQRYEMTINRKKLKNEENDLRRSLDNLRLADVDLPALANKLKSRSQVTATDLRTLKNLLIQDEKNINLVLKTQGALRGLVRELTGVCVDRQLEAAGCLCNLALTDWRGCLSITNAAGAYLIAALDSQNLQLAVTCAWTLGNVCGAGGTCATALSGLGAVPRLCARLAGEAQRADAAVYALTLYAHALGDRLSEEHLKLIMRSVGPSLCRNSFRLFYILSCHPFFEDPQNHVLKHLLHRFPHMMKWHYDKCVAPECCDVLLGIRTLANLEQDSAYYSFLVRMHEGTARKRNFTELIQDPRLKLSMLWLLGNMSRRRDHHQFLKCYNWLNVAPPEPERAPVEPPLEPEPRAPVGPPPEPVGPPPEPRRGHGFERFSNELPKLPAIVHRYDDDDVFE